LAHLAEIADGLSVRLHERLQGAYLSRKKYASIRQELGTAFSELSSRAADLRPTHLALFSFFEDVDFPNRLNAGYVASCKSEYAPFFKELDSQ
jgi:hypothetical protein